MSKICEICGKVPQTGNHIVRHGLAKYKGGIGLHTTAVTRRRFMPNLHRVKAVVDGTTRTIWACAACIKSGRVVKAPRAKKAAPAAEA
ncbi:MAG: 50S ribosomal protein L28 [Kiritimatiellae bacterium]|nr:50S ribosomal protein L28 [Kiritimatiellia bacterium]MBR1835682.1 50S ribosomal protein L28 [Kiritimatiellia bacterium]